MSSTQKNFALPLAFIGIMFFAIGFALGINSVLIPVLQGSLGITSAESYLIIAATFVPFLIFGYPASMTIKAIGYKHTMALSFAMFSVAFGLYIPSASQESFPLSRRISKIPFPVGCSDKIVAISSFSGSLFCQRHGKRILTSIC